MHFNNFDTFCKHFNLQSITSSKLFVEATTHASNRTALNYERLEFLGDTILNMHVSVALFDIFQSDNEGLLSQKKGFLVSRETCAKVAHNICLVDKLTTKDCIANESILAGAFEALLAVIYLTNENGSNIISQIIDELIMPYLSEYSENPKTALQHFAQEKYKCLPEYTLISKSGTEHEPIFEIEVKIGKHSAIGFGANKKLAEKKAAAKLLSVLI